MYLQLVLLYLFLQNVHFLRVIYYLQLQYEQF